jgi:hypothetical protein
MWQKQTYRSCQFYKKALHKLFFYIFISFLLYIFILNFWAHRCMASPPSSTSGALTGSRRAEPSPAFTRTGGARGRPAPRPSWPEVAELGPAGARGRPTATTPTLAGGRHALPWPEVAAPWPEVAEPGPSGSRLAWPELVADQPPPHLLWPQVAVPHPGQSSWLTEPGFGGGGRPSRAVRCSVVVGRSVAREFLTGVDDESGNFSPE